MHFSLSDTCPLFVCLFVCFWIVELALSPVAKAEANWCNTLHMNNHLFPPLCWSPQGRQAAGQFLKALPSLLDPQVSPRWSPCPVTRIWLPGGDHACGSLLRALAFARGGVEKPLTCLSLLLAVGIQLLEFFQLFVCDHGFLIIKEGLL